MIAKGILGGGFKGTAAYILHDKGADTAERVAWTCTENLRSDDPERAWREMAWTATHADSLKRASGQKLTGRKADKPVYHLSLSWAKDEAPTQEEMIAAGREALRSLGLDRHQTLMVCHQDEPQPHIHILVNRVDHETGVMNRLSHSRRKLSAWALEYERAQGQIRCEQRVENNQALTRDEKPRHTDEVIRTAWERSDTGQAFRQALAEQGYILARGNKRIVVVDPHGKAINPARQLRGVKAAAITARLGDLDMAALPTVEQVRQRQESARPAGQMPGGAVGKEEAGAVRREFAQAAALPAQDREAAPAESPLREDYNAEWEKAVAEGAVAADQAREARERFARAARQSGGQATGGHAGDSTRGYFPGEPPERAPSNDNDSAGANRQRAALQSRHLEELGELGRAQHLKRLENDDRLRRFYDTTASRDELRTLEKKRWLFRKGRRRMEELRLTIEDAAGREHEARQNFQRQQETEYALVTGRQAHEREALEQALRNQPPDRPEESDRAREARERIERAERERAQHPHRRQHRRSRE